MAFNRVFSENEAFPKEKSFHTLKRSMYAFQASSNIENRTNLTWPQTQNRMESLVGVTNVGKFFDFDLILIKFRFLYIYTRNLQQTCKLNT